MNFNFSFFFKFKLYIYLDYIDIILYASIPWYKIMLLYLEIWDWKYLLFR